jgi:hypothetical protein
VLKSGKTGDFKGENMKKLIVLALFLSVVVLPAFAQNARFTVAELVERAVSKLDRPVPAGFQRVDRTTFINDDNFIIHIMNGLVFRSSVAGVAETSHEAYAALGRLYDFFEDSQNRWVLNPYAGVSVYHNSGVYAIIVRPVRRHDGLFVTMVSFSNQL